jgi:Sec-independent protein translocase protein TatA
VGLGIDIVFILMLGLLVLGPKQLHTLLGHVARAKSQFEEASRGFKSQLTMELDAVKQDGETDPSASYELAGDQERPGVTAHHTPRQAGRCGQLT